MISLLDFICYLRNQLVVAKAAEDEFQIQEIGSTLYLLENAMLEMHDVTYLGIVDDLIDAIRHFKVAEFKVQIPTEEQIRSTAQSSRNDNI